MRETFEYVLALLAEIGSSRWHLVAGVAQDEALTGRALPDTSIYKAIALRVCREVAPEAELKQPESA